MRVVTCICLSVAALALAVGLAAAAPPSGAAATTSPAAPPQTTPQPGTGKPPGAKPPAATRPVQPPSPRLGERRRRSYASCNRESHRRELHGGARRRFLIRCKLGMERRGPGPSAAPSPSPQPGKRP